LRHGFASVAAAGGMGLPIIGKMLGHTQAQTTQRYALLASDPVKAAAAATAARIVAAMKGDASDDDKVVLMRSRAAAIWPHLANRNTPHMPAPRT
jgi:hypothetical protein